MLTHHARAHRGSTWPEHTHTLTLTLTHAKCTSHWSAGLILVSDCKKLELITGSNNRGEGGKAGRGETEEEEE